MGIFKYSRSRTKQYPEHPGTWAELTERSRFKIRWIRTSVRLHLVKEDADRLVAGQTAGAGLMAALLGPSVAGKIATAVASAILLVQKYHRNADGSLDVRFYNGTITIGSPEVPVTLDPITPTTILQSFAI